MILIKAVKTDKARLRFMHNQSSSATIINLHPRDRTNVCDPNLRHKLSTRTHKPLAITLDATLGIKALAEHGKLGDFLQKELKLWRKALGLRKISCLELHYNDENLQPFAITGLIHRIASDFDVSAAIYRVVISPELAQAEVLALLRGLSFDHCQFVLEHAQADNLQILDEPIAEAKTYKFSRVGVQIQHSEGMENLRKSIRLLRETYSPDYIYIGGATYRLGDKELNQQTTLFEDDLAHCSADHLSLGPGSASKFGSLDLSSFADIDRYMSELDRGHLPLHQAHLHSEK